MVTSQSKEPTPTQAGGVTIRMYKKSFSSEPTNGETHPIQEGIHNSNAPRVKLICSKVLLIIQDIIQLD
eukprot:5170740-Amphidinium_carterae.1